MDINEAYKILGVSETASDEEVEKQYMVWVRRNRALLTEQTSNNDLNMDEITTAYNTIKTFRQYGSVTPVEEQSFKKKVGHFFYYYKLHIVGVLVLLAVLGSIIFTIVENYQEKKALENLPPENVRVLLLGEYFNISNETTPVADNILAQFPDWERVTVNLNYSPLTVNDSMDVASQQKSVVTLVEDNSDIFLMDYANYERLVVADVFQPIDQVDPSIKEAVDSSKLVFSSTEEDKTEQLYGIIIEDMSIFKGFDMKETQIVAAIKKGAENKENAVELIKKLAK